MAWRGIWNPKPKTYTPKPILRMTHPLDWLCGVVVLWLFLGETEVKQRWARLVHGWVTVHDRSRFIAQWGILMQPKNRYRMTPGVRHSSILNWLIYLFMTGLLSFNSPPGTTSPIQPGNPGFSLHFSRRKEMRACLNFHGKVTWLERFARWIWNRRESPAHWF